MKKKSQRDSLLEAAQTAALSSYSPYSLFRVGAAVLTEKGVFSGTNIENASFGLTLCAERTAMAAAIVAGAKKFLGVGVACIDAKPDAGIYALTPCGACRQWMMEFFPKDAKIHIVGIRRSFTIEELFPYGFDLKPRK